MADFLAAVFTAGALTATAGALEIVGVIGEVCAVTFFAGLFTEILRDRANRESKIDIALLYVII